MHKRILGAVLSSLMALTAFEVVLPAVAQADGPSVELPDTPQTPVTKPDPKPARPADQASTAALSGDQPTSPTPPAGGGNLTATSLAPSANWSVSANTGDFNWSYPLRVPPAPGGLEPKLALGYSSSAVDGRTSATNNQASWVGDGWDLQAGYIERIYGGCADDDMGGTTPPKTGDNCWRNDNAMSSEKGPLIAETGNRWRSKSDDGSRIERLTGAANGDNDGEHWKITAPDGTQYFYGSRPEAKSTWTVPVYGDDAGEPCHGSTFESSRCVQAWRWQLDKVVDPHGNMMLYGYEVETNKYGANLKDDGVAYIRAGSLRTIEYGLRSDGSVVSSGQVEFILGDRCVPGSTCIPTKKENWPDVAWASQCDGATCAGNYAPTFWTTKRLAKIVTRVRGATGFTDVDSWTLEHQFPNPGDQEKAALWLKSIVHTGHVGGTAALPAVTFEGTAKPNRVSVTTGVGPLNRYRITGIVSETGGTIAVVYAPADCATQPTSQEHNTSRCYPVRWTPPGGNERTEYFHKYVVQEIVESDRYEGTSEQRTVYDYLDGAAWHFDTSEFAKEAKKTYSEFRGFGRVRVRKGNANDPAGPITELEQRFFRGMDGDRLPNNGKRSVNVTDSRGGSHLDSDWFAGMELEKAKLNGVGGAVVETTVTTYKAQGPNATRGDLKSYLVRPETVASHVSLPDDAWRVVRTDSEYDDRGLVTEVDYAGDVSKTEDDKCTRKTYARNEDRWIIALPYRTWTVGARCASTSDEVLDDTRTGYDGLAIGTAPNAGAVTRTEELAEGGYVRTSSATHDAHGRVLTATDAVGAVTRTVYTPEVGGPATKVVTTNALGHVTSQTLAPAWGEATLIVDPNLRRSEVTYDALGRKTAIWLGNRKRSQGETPNAKFSYLIRQDGHNVVTASSLNARGDYVTVKQIHDSLMRPRQIQTPALGGGRMLTDTRYDSQGRAYLNTQPYFHNSAVDDTLWVASSVETLGATMNVFDGAGRTVAVATRGGGVEKWRTSYAYEGDRVRTTPPQGGTATTTVTDAQGRAIEVHQGSAPDVTKYSYTRGGELASIVDAAGNTWRYTYDLRGNAIKAEDPDKGTTLMEYDAAGRMTATTDARGVKLSYGYDALGREISVAQGTATLASWVYDTATYGKGFLAKTIRHVGSTQYITSISSYNQLNKPVSITLTVPEQEQGLAGSYTTELRYDYDGGQASKAMPAIGDLPGEGVVSERNELGLPTITRGGFNGQTIGYVTDTVYTRQGELARMQFGEGTKRAWQSFYYDAHTRRLDRSISDVEAPAPMQADVRYTYDPAGNITSIVDAPLDKPADKQCFRYDYLRRLTEAWTPAGGCDTSTLGGPAQYRHEYTYDKVGNRVTAKIDGVTSNYSYPAPGSPRPHAVTSTSTTGSYAYDAAGNMTARPGQTLEWDAEGRLGKVGETSFVYDANGDRLIRRTRDTVTLYLDGQELTLERSNGRLTGTRYYTHSGRTVAVRTGGKLNWLMADHQGTTQLAVDADTMGVEQKRQAPFGVDRGIPGNVPGERGFVGGTQDATTGLLHIGAREYDAALGRFISVDPVMGSEPQLLNAYAYSNNNPVTFSDPTGLYCDSCDYYRYEEQKNQARFCDSCEYYDYTKGESSVWSPPKQRKSFCDSCEYYSVKEKTKSAWNRRDYSDRERPTIFGISEVLNQRLAIEKAEAERKAKEAQEEADCGFWCKAGRWAKKTVNSDMFKWTAIAFSLVGMMACPLCAAIGWAGYAMSVAGTISSCAEGNQKTECSMGVLTAVMGPAGQLYTALGKGAINVGAKWAEKGWSLRSRVADKVGVAMHNFGVGVSMTSVGLDMLGAWDVYKTK